MCGPIHMTVESSEKQDYILYRWLIRNSYSDQISYYAQFILVFVLEQSFDPSPRSSNSEH